MVEIIVCCACAALDRVEQGVAGLGRLSAIFILPGSINTNKAVNGRVGAVRISRTLKALSDRCRGTDDITEAARRAVLAAVTMPLTLIRSRPASALA
jgi:hypothetical protein